MCLVNWLKPYTALLFSLKFPTTVTDSSICCLLMNGNKNVRQSANALVKIKTEAKTTNHVSRAELTATLKVEISSIYIAVAGVSSFHLMILLFSPQSRVGIFCCR